MFKGDADVQIEQYFTFQVTEMQITFTSLGVYVAFPCLVSLGPAKLHSSLSRLTMDNSLQYTRNIQFKSE